MPARPLVTPSESDYAVAIDQRYFEDDAQGLGAASEPAEVSEAEIAEFARRFDHQDFHVEPDRAASGPCGGLVASGWHTAAPMMRVLVEPYLSTVASLGSPGVDELRWIAPVRTGEHLWVRINVVEARRSQTTPDRGLIRSAIEVCNDQGEARMTLKAMTVMRGRPTAAAREAVT